MRRGGWGQGAGEANRAAAAALSTPPSGGFLGHTRVRAPGGGPLQRLNGQERATTTGDSKSRAHVSLPSVLGTLYAQTGGQTK